MLEVLSMACHLPTPAVFDDGDERTLKRSSLCLKGGRHFDKSEVCVWGRQDSRVLGGRVCVWGRQDSRVLGGRVCM